MYKIKTSELENLANTFDTGNGRGYVLDFSDRTFSIYFDEHFDINIDDEKYRTGGSSKWNRLKTFLCSEPSQIAAKVLRELWEYRSAVLDKQGKEDAPLVYEKYFKIVHALEGAVETISTDAIEKFSDNETLDELVSAIQREISANKPHVALDRLHTYCMKKFSHLLVLHGSTCEKEEPLHGRAGRYIKILESQNRVQGISLRIMKSSISTFDGLNPIRNDKSFAHDNDLLTMHEARFIFESISSILRLIRSLEAQKYGS